MSRKYKFHDPEGLYFVSFATVYWIDVFTREVYFNILVENLMYCIKNKGLLLYSWCIMPIHVHLIFRTLDNNPSKVLGDFKSFTSRVLFKEIQDSIIESRREWMLNLFRDAALKQKNASKFQLWQHDSHPIALCSPEVIDQKVEYTHMNPVTAGYVEEPHYWKYSSAIDFNGGKGLLDLIEF